MIKVSTYNFIFEVFKTFSYYSGVQCNFCQPHVSAGAQKYEVC